MSKRIKRTLAILLVVCALFGLVAVPAVATDGESAAATPKTYVYDFTVLANKTNTHTYETEEQKTQNVFWGHSSAKFFGLGNTNYLCIEPSPERTVTDFYDLGYSTFTYGSGDEAVTYTTTLDLNWQVLTGKDLNHEKYTFTFPDGVTATGDFIKDHCLQGGYYFRNNLNAGSSKHNYNGLSYFHRVLDETTYNKNDDDGSFKSFAFKDMPGGWVAIKIKAPEVGKYKVNFGYTTHNSGACRSSIYILPGVVSDSATIENAIANSIGKMAGSVNYYYNSSKYTSANTNIGTYTVSEPVDEYTVIITTDTNSKNETVAGSARAFIDSLTFTEVPEDTADSVTYDFRLQNIYGKTEFPEKSNLKTDEVVEKVASKYNQTGWTYLGTNFTSDCQVRNNFLYMYGAGSNSKFYYYAMKLKSPGEGTYNLDLNTYCMTYSGAVTNGNKYTYTAPLWLDAYLIKLTDDMTEANYDTYLKDATLVGSYEIEPSNTVAQSSYFTDNLGTFTFEADAEYILYLRRTTKKLDNSATDQATDEEEVYIVNASYPCYLRATKMPEFVATIGEDFISADDQVYNIGMNPSSSELGKYMNDLQESGAYVNLTDGTQGRLLSYKDGSNAAWRMFRSSKHLSEKSGMFYNADLINKAKDLYDNEKINWQFLDFLNPKAGSDVRYDNSNIVIYTMRGANENAQGKVGNTVAFLIRSPGDGNFNVKFKMSCQVKAGYTTANLWLNAYLVKVEGDVTVDTFRDHKPETPIGEFTEDYFHTGTSSVQTEVPLTVKGDESKPNANVYFEEGAQYILYLEAHEDADTYAEPLVEGVTSYHSASSLFLLNMSFDCIDDDYTTLTAALDAAEPGETVKLQQDALLNEVVIPEGVTLDLNGHTLTTAVVGPMGKLVGNGVLKTYASTNVNAELMAENTLPLYDASVNGYKLFKYSYLNAQTEEVGNDTVKFWYQLLFEDAAAYDLIETGTSGFTMGVDLTADDVYAPCTFKNSRQTGEEIVNDANAWAAAYATFAKATLAKDKTPWLYVNVTNAAMADAISVAPVITTGNADYKLAAINYGLKEDK